MIKAARISALIYVGLLTVFALLSGAGGEGGILSNLPNAAPWLLAWASILVAWKYPTAGGWLFLLLAALSLLFFNTYRETVPFVLVTAPLAAIGALFLTARGAKGADEKA